MATDAYAIHVEPDPYRQFYISQGFRVGDLVFVSGQIPITAEGAMIDGDFDTQAEATFRNLQRVLEAAGTSLAKTIKVTIFLTDMKTQRPKVMALRQRWFTPPYPADTLVEVSALGDPRRLLEIEAIALADGELRE